MTNYEKIKSMSIDDMIEKIYQLGDKRCLYCKNKSCMFDCTDVFVCIKGIRSWLNSKANN